jgi:hypothetical protein
MGEIYFVGRRAAGVAGKQNLVPASIPVLFARAVRIGTPATIHRLGRQVSIVRVFLDVALVQSSEHRVTKQSYDDGRNERKDLSPRAKRTKYRHYRRDPRDAFEDHYNESLRWAQSIWFYVAIVAGSD